MRQSQLFTRTRKQVAADEVSKNAQLLLRAGFVHKEMAGVYTLLPLGLRTLRRIESIVRNEMDNLGAQEVLMTTLQSKELWEKTGRWNDAVVDNWFKTALKNNTEIGLAFTHEEPLTSMLTQYISSHKDLPRFVYQIQTKFRNELRAKSGIMRGREFIMKDMYSFSDSQENHERMYNAAHEAYTKVFDKLGIGEKTYFTFASGGSFSKFSHEFQAVCEAGEDIIYVDEEKKIAVNKEVYTDQVLHELGLTKTDLVEKKAIEVGNIFSLGTKFSSPLGLQFTDDTGTVGSVVMGAYGIGVSRLIGAIVELNNDNSGIVWPASVAPFDVHLIALGDGESRSQAEVLYTKLKGDGIDVLHDDRDARAGEKFMESDLIGIPFRIVISAKTLEQGMVELKERRESEVHMIKTDSLVGELKKRLIP